MSTTSAIRFLAGTKKDPLGSLRLQCHVKPGASRVREGVLAVADDVIELCVAAQAREGEANKAVVKLLSEVSCPLGSFPFSRTFWGHVGGGRGAGLGGRQGRG